MECFQNRKVNYLVHTKAVKERLIPDDLSKSKKRFVYADEADLLNFALFNKTAASWRKEHPDEKGNIRDPDGHLKMPHLWPGKSAPPWKTDFTSVWRIGT